MPGNVQDGFLAGLRSRGVPVALTLTNGGALEGVVTAFDSFTLVVRQGALHHLVYKHAVATIAPANGVDFVPTSESP
jgi:host factor-I protein